MNVLERISEQASTLAGIAGRVARTALAIVVLTTAGVSLGQGVSPTGGMAFRAYRVQHVDARSVEPTLRGLVPPGTQVLVDERANQLLVQGGENVQRIAAATLQAMDRPRTTPSPAAAPAFMRSYPCPRGQAHALAERFHRQYGSMPGVTISGDERASKVLVMAPAEVHDRVAPELRLSGVQPAAYEAPIQRVADSRVRTAGASSTDAWRRGPSPVTYSQYEEPAPAPAVGTPPLPTAVTHSMSSSVSRIVPLRRMTATAFEKKLVDTLGKRAIPVQNLSPTDMASVYRMPLADDTTLTITVDRARNDVTLLGSPSAVQSSERLIRLLDDAEGAGDSRMQLLTYDTRKNATVHRVAQALDQTVGSQPEVPESSSPGVRFAPGAPGADPTMLVEAAQRAGILGPVQIDFIDGFDMAVVQGDPEDVRQVVELINQIEAMSLEQEPQIVIYPMRHAEGSRVGTLVDELYQEVFNVRQGAVSITPLVKPNAIMLIGRDDSVKTALDLIRRLDQPVSPDSQFQVFRLRHAAAETVRQQLEEFYDEREGLGVVIRVTADFRSNAVIVQAAPRDLIEVAAMIMRLDTSDSAAVNEIRLFPLKNALADELAPVLQEAVTGETSSNAEQKSAMLSFATIDAGQKRLLQSGILSDVRITSDTRSNALLVSASAESMPLIEALIRQMDQLPVAEAQIKVFTIINSDASGLAEMLDQLFGTTSTQASQINIRTGAREGESTLVSMRFAVDVRTNSIIATGSEGDLNVVEAILLRLDESDIHNRKVFVYRLLNTQAEPVAQALNDYLQNERTVEQATTGIVSTFEQFNREVVIVFEELSNSLIVSTTPRYYDQIKKIIEQLDERPPMVMIDVVIAEVSLSDAQEIGFEAGIQDSILFDRSGVESFQAITQTISDPGQPQVTSQQIISQELNPGFLFNSINPLGNNNANSSAADLIGTQGISNFGMGRASSELGFGGFVFSASSESLSILIRALQQESKIDILSRPQIMTLDLQPAFIQVGEQVPMISSTQTNDSGGITNTVSPEDVGLILGITPRISPDGLVVIEVEAEKSAVGPESEGIPIAVQDGVTIRSPRIETISATTSISAMDGQTVILGGLITKQKSTETRKVPLLGDIPVVGQLFRFDSYRDRRSELLFILTPRIVRGQGDVEMIKHIESARMNWCMCDVREFNDDPALRKRGDDWSDMNVPTVHPMGPPSPEMLPPEYSDSPEVLPTPPARPMRSIPDFTMPTPAPALAPEQLNAPTPTPRREVRGAAAYGPELNGQVRSPEMRSPEEAPDAYGRSAVTRASYREGDPRMAPTPPVDRSYQPGYGQPYAPAEAYEPGREYTPARNPVEPAGYHASWRDRSSTITAPRYR